MRRIRIFTKQHTNTLRDAYNRTNNVVRWLYRSIIPAHSQKVFQNRLASSSNTPVRSAEVFAQSIYYTMSSRSSNPPPPAIGITAHIAFMCAQFAGKFDPKIFTLSERAECEIKRSIESVYNSSGRVIRRGSLRRCESDADVGTLTLDGKSSA